MATVFEVDQFTSLQSMEAFAGRCNAVAETIDVLGLQGRDKREGPALVIGGAVLAMQEVDSYVPNGSLFDLDVIVPPAMFYRLKREVGFGGGIVRFGKGAHASILPSKSIPLRVDVLSSNDPSDFEMFTGGMPYAGRPNRSILPIGGVHVLRGSVVAAQKSRLIVARVKDLTGVIKGHVTAAHAEHPIVDQELWKLSVGAAIDRIVERDVEVPLWRRITKRGPNYPSWLSQLVEANFEHPAFAGIPR